MEVTQAVLARCRPALHLSKAWSVYYDRSFKPFME